MHIELLETSAIAPLVDHLVRNARESGRDGDFLSRTRSADDPPDREAMHARLVTGWAKGIGDTGWERAFGLWSDDLLVGHLDLRGGSLPSDLHRATLGIGIERPWRRAGWGRTLMETARVWAHAQGLSWLDLGVFGENTPARALYRSLGYVETGRTEDRFRVDGRQVDDISMVLRLR